MDRLKQKAEMKIGRPSNPSSLRDDGVEVCDFCKGVVGRRKVMLFGVERDFGPERCTCDGSKAFWGEYERKLQAAIKAEKEREQQEFIQTLTRQSMIPDKFTDRTFERFTTTAHNEKAFQQARAYADGFTPGQGVGMLFTGTVGTGKTHLAAAIALELLQREFSVVFGTVTNLLAQIRNTYESDRETELQVFNRLVRCQLLIIDDLGKERVTDWVEQTVFEIINTRYENNKSLVITTNLSLTDIRSKYPNNGDAIVDRILEMCQGVKMVGDSWRKRAVI